MMPEAQANAPLSYVEVTEQKRLNEAREQGIPFGRSGGPTSASGSGVPSAKITATMAMLGTTSRTTSCVHVPITLAKTNSLVSPTTSSSSASRSLYGTSANSNWRGPVWMPVNGLIIRGLLNMYPFYGDDFKVECPTGSSRAIRTASGRFTEERRSSRRILTGATTSSSTNISTATTARAWEPASKPDGPVLSPARLTSLRE